MGSRDRDTKSLQDKLKVFFKKAGVPARSELVVTPELERELGPEAPLHRRLRAVRDLTDKALQLRIQDGGVETVWRCTRDLLEGGGEGRLAALALLRGVAEGQAGRLSVMRTVLLRYLRASHAARAPDDDTPRFRLLHALTNTGKNITCFEEEIGPFLVEWLPQIQHPALLVEFLQLVTNVVKFNASSLDEDVVQGIVEVSCGIVERGEGAALGAALALLEAVVSYSLLPAAALPAFAAALCRAVNLEPYTQPCWKLMRLVVGGDIGHAALLALVQILRGAGGAGVAGGAGGAGEVDAGLVRGAVFYINMALWGAHRVPTLKVSFLAVLPAFLQAVELGQPVVTYEVVVALGALVTRCGGALQEPAWGALLGALRAALPPRNELVAARLHALLTQLEQLQLAGGFKGDLDQLLDLVDAAGHERPEASTMWLVSARAAALSPVRAECGGAALQLAERYLRRDPRRAVRLHTLQAIHAFIVRHRVVYGEELVERVGVPVLGAAAADADAGLRAAAAAAAAELARAAAGDVTVDLIDLLGRILERPFETGVDLPLAADADVSDLTAACGGLLALLAERLPRAPPAHAARAFLVLLDHLDHHYRRPALFQHHPDIRLKIFEMLFGLRTNAYNCVGFCYDAGGRVLHGPAAARAKLVCSPYLLADGGSGSNCGGGVRRAGGETCVLPTGRAARALAAALTREGDWRVLGCVLRALPGLLAARAAAAPRRPQDLDLLASTLCGMLSERSAALCGGAGAGGGRGARPTLSEFQAAALPSLAALAPYHAYLEPHTQQRIVRCLLKFGMVLRSPQPYIGALTVFTLEMRDTMVKMLPEVLLDLSKISDTQLIASPMLEFLSTLTRLPRVFASFVEDQYMSVFAILLPYTNPSRYNHYVVSLAHHVIAAWFLKCRLSYRRNFVRFIIHGLHNYIIMPFEEQLQRPPRPPPPANEDSSNRQRSSSLGSRAVPRTPLGGRAAAGGSASAAFHVELTETCVDLLSRYAFTPCSVKPHRSDTAEFLFEGGQSATWLVGHKLVTITTSGCLQHSIKQGLCDRCATLCRQHAERAASPLPPAAPPPAAEPPPVSAALSQTAASASLAPQPTPGAAPATEAPAPAPDVRRQNSGEGARDPVADALAHFSERFERLSREVDGARAALGRVGELAGGGACPCWCAQWCEVRVRSPAGDTAWSMRLHNRTQDRDDALQDLAALLAGPRPAPPAPPPEPAPPAPAAPPGGPRPARAPTLPINIPGSPQRQSSSSTTDDDDLLLVVPSGKSRHPVRRSNSSPEMSSWKLSAREGELAGAGVGGAGGPGAEPEMIVLPGVEPSVKKPAKKSDMRVSCEAIPEEMSGTSPLAPPLVPHHPPPHPQHHHLMTYNSDPGSRSETDTELETSGDSAHHQLQKTASDSTVSAAPGGGGGAEGAARDDLPPLARSKRSNTISVMSPTRRHRDSGATSGVSARTGGAGGGGARGAAGGGAAGGGGLTPAFVFLQLYHNMSTYPITPPVPGSAPTLLNPLAERPLRVAGVQHERTIKNLDLVPPLETYKVGVLYVGPGQQDDEVAILRNEYGSVRYSEFLTGLGTLVSLEAGAEGAGGGELFLNLETGGKDGRYTYVWTDDIMQVQFHVATAMPSSAKDPNCNEKRKYIGNDYVSIVYNDSGADFNIHTIKGQLNFCIVVVEPFEHGLNRVFIKTKDERIRTKFLAHLDTHTVSDPNVALLARQTALHCALASQISQSLTLGGLPYASNALERLRLVKRLRRRAEAERLAAAARAPEPYAPTPQLHQRVAIDDFNDYT